jgi:hypothetical protein
LDELEGDVLRTCEVGTIEVGGVLPLIYWIAKSINVSNLLEDKDEIGQAFWN